MLFLQMLKISALCAVTGVVRGAADKGVHPEDSNQIMFYKWSPSMGLTFRVGPWRKHLRWELRYFNKEKILGQLLPTRKRQRANGGIFEYSEETSFVRKEKFKVKNSLDLSKCYIISNLDRDDTCALHDLHTPTDQKGSDGMRPCAIVQTLGQRKDNSGKSERPFLLKMHEEDIRLFREHAMNGSENNKQFRCENLRSSNGKGGVIVYQDQGQTMFRYYNNTNVSENFGAASANDDTGISVVATSRIHLGLDAIQFDFFRAGKSISGQEKLILPGNPGSADHYSNGVNAGKLFRYLRDANRIDEKKSKIES